MKKSKCADIWSVLPWLSLLLPALISYCCVQRLAPQLTNAVLVLPLLVVATTGGTAGGNAAGGTADGIAGGSTTGGTAAGGGSTGGTAGGIAGGGTTSGTTGGTAGGAADGTAGGGMAGNGSDNTSSTREVTTVLLYWGLYSSNGNEVEVKECRQLPLPEIIAI